LIYSTTLTTWWSSSKFLLVWLKKWGIPCMNIIKRRKTCFMNGEPESCCLADHRLVDPRLLTMISLCGTSPWCREHGQNYRMWDPNNIHTLLSLLSTTSSSKRSSIPVKVWECSAWETIVNKVTLWRWISTQSYGLKNVRRLGISNVSELVIESCALWKKLVLYQDLILKLVFETIAALMSSPSYPPVVAEILLHPSHPQVMSYHELSWYHEQELE